jgi:hypothetical protein
MTVLVMVPDMREVIAQVGFGRLRWVLALSQMTILIESFRSAFLADGMPPLPKLAVSLVIMLTRSSAPACTRSHGVDPSRDLI